MTKPDWEWQWQLVAVAHGGELCPDRKTRMIDLGKRPKIERDKQGWVRYSDAVVSLCMLAGRGNTGLRMHVGYGGRGRLLTRDA